MMEVDWKVIVIAVGLIVSWVWKIASIKLASRAAGDGMERLTGQVTQIHETLKQLISIHNALANRVTRLETLAEAWGQGT